MSRIEFKPPSDFVSDSSGAGGKSKIWKILGIGCLITVILLGVVRAFGAWQTVSCCGTAKDFFVKGSMAREVALQVGNDLKTQEYESIRTKMSPALAAEISAEQLSVQRLEYASFIEHASPNFINITNRDSENWDVSIEFAPPTRSEKLVVMMSIHAVDGESADAPTLELASLVFEQRRRDLRAEPAAVAVLGFHRELSSGNDENAYGFVQSQFPELSTFRTFLKEQKPIFREGTVEIESVDNQPNLSVVVAKIAGDGSQRVRVEYELGPARTSIGEFEIRKITPTYQNVPPQAGDADAGAPDEAAPDSREQGDSEEPVAPDGE